MCKETRGKGEGKGRKLFSAGNHRRRPPPRGDQVDFVIREAQVIAIESYLAENYQEDNSDDHCDNGTDQLSPEC